MASAAYEKNQEKFLSLVWENDPINTVTEFLGKNIGQVVSEKVQGEKNLKLWHYVNSSPDNWPLTARPRQLAL